jgi:predicted phage tail protein
MKEIPPTLEGLPLQEEICLYRELLECFEEEWQALLNSQEEAILALATQKEQILGKIAAADPGRGISDPRGQESKLLDRLKHQAATAQARNHRLITAALETIQDFLGHLQSAPPGTYHSAGKVETTPGSSFFHRQA